MRKGYDCHTIMDDNNVFIGFSLGADFTAEHEWGIKRMRREYGIDSDKDGYKGTKITKIPECFSYDPETNLIVSATYGARDIHDLSDMREGISAAWDERSFAIRVQDEHKKQMEELVNAFNKKDIAITIAGRDGFANGGLCLMIYSRIPKEVKKEAVEQSKRHNELLKAVEKTGIKEALKKAGKEYFALSPKWKDYNKKEIIYWLNPMEQDRNNFGWMRIEDLHDWIEDKGKIPKGE